ncbi:TPA: hypothetical protein ACPJ0G_001221 [Vibrio alginolyticus]|uniref:hypothetical protein n=1 Tax=Vibrio parahaemolyticus TaxID=670 RepID=UPI0001BC6E6D|nr:hypothetical protein [Vibrio parahaemolyticus]EFO40855.1 conserved hypothetical protein [Vibrio parahaemolyticus AN-5034]EJG1965087.1 hypothetical protein [Vibrio parahaemolyticus]
MSYVKDKNKNQILEELVSTAELGTKVHEQQKSAIIVRCTEDIQDSINELGYEIDKLKSAFEDSSKSSGKVALALNWLTSALVLVGVAQVVVAIMK